MLSCDRTEKPKALAELPYSLGSSNVTSSERLSWMSSMSSALTLFTKKCHACSSLGHCAAVFN